MRLDDVTAEDLVRADTAVVAAGGPESRRRGSRAGAPCRRRCTPARCRRSAPARRTSPPPRPARHGCWTVRRHVDVQDLAHHEDVVAAADRVRNVVDGLEHAAPLGLVRGRPVEAPDRQLDALGVVAQYLRLGTELGRRLGAVDPDVLSLEGHGPHPSGCVLGALRVLRRCGTGAPRYCPAACQQAISRSLLDANPVLPGVSAPRLTRPERCASSSPTRSRRPRAHASGHRGPPGPGRRRLVCDGFAGAHRALRPVNALYVSVLVYVPVLPSVAANSRTHDPHRAGGPGRGAAAARGPAGTAVRSADFLSRQVQALTPPSRSGPGGSGTCPAPGPARTPRC